MTHDDDSSASGEVFNPLDSKCDEMETVCCRLPEWVGVPFEERHKIKLPEQIPVQCLGEPKDDERK